MTKPITCDCEEFDRDIATEDRCYCGHAYDQHSEADGLVCTATETYPARLAADDFHDAVCTGPGGPTGFTCSHPTHAARLAAESTPGVLMPTYRTGNHWGVTIVRQPDTGGICADQSCPDRGDHPSHDQAQLVAVVVNGDQALAERICALLNGAAEQELAEGRQGLADMQERADVRRRIAERAEHRPSSLGDGLGYGPCVGCGELWPCQQSRRECPA